MTRLLGALFALACLGAAEPEPISRVVDYEPSVSADGQRIAFISNRDGRFKLYVMNADRSGLTRLTDDGGVDDNPCWSPDGARIAFVSEVGGNSDVYVIDADGANRRRLTTDPGYDIHPTWSTDGRRLLFNSLRRAAAPEHIDVYELDLATGAERRITNELSASYASWSPNGSAILVRAMFGGNSEIALMSPRGRVLRRLTSNPSFDGWPSWSPDGAHIVFAREREADEAADLYIIDANGENERALLGGPGRKTNPRWSAEGVIVFSRSLEREVRLWRIPAPDWESGE